MSKWSRKNFGWLKAAPAWLNPSTSSKNKKPLGRQTERLKENLVETKLEGEDQLNRSR